MQYARRNIPFYYIDPRPQLNYELSNMPNLTIMEEPASTGVRKMVELIVK
jgi:hypothetical protein